MLTVFRAHHKRILWALVFIIVPAFVLWGGLSYFRQKKDQRIGRIDGRPITESELSEYQKLAQVFFLLYGPKDDTTNITAEHVSNKAWEFLLLLWKAKKDRVTVSDKEVVSLIAKIFPPNKKDGQEFYQRFLRYRLNMVPREFEECVRKLLIVQKVIEKNIAVSVTDEEIKELYRRDTQKAKIAYLFVPYARFEDTIVVNKNEPHEFYDAHRTLFKREPKVQIRYVLIAKDSENKQELLAALPHVKTLSDLLENVTIEAITTDFIGMQDPIEGIGWQPALNQMAFSLAVGEISPPFQTQSGVVLFEKVAEQEAMIPEFEQIQEEVLTRLKENKLKKATAAFCESILNDIKTNEITDLQKVAANGVEFKETEYFKYYDYIEGLGLDPQVSQLVFTMQEGQIHPQPILLLKGGYIIQLKNRSPIDEAAFTQEKDRYRQRLEQQKELVEGRKFLAELQSKSRLEIVINPQQ